MNKNDIINEVVSSLVFSLNKDQLELVKSTFIVKMQGYEIHELCTLPSTEVRDNDFIFKRFTVDMLAKGLKQSSIKNYMDHIRPFFDMTGKNYRDITSQDIIDLRKSGTMISFSRGLPWTCLPKDLSRVALRTIWTISDHFLI